jgi:hypothetical protein
MSIQLGSIRRSFRAAGNRSMDVRKR